MGRLFSMDSDGLCFDNLLMSGSSPALQSQSCTTGAPHPTAGRCGSRTSIAPSTRGSFYPLQIIRCAYGRRLILVPQLLFGKMVELVVPTFGLTSFLPKFVRASDDVFFGSHVFAPWSPRANSGFPIKEVIFAPADAVCSSSLTSVPSECHRVFISAD